MDPFEQFEESFGNSGNVNAESDPAAEFLAREQAELARIENDTFHLDIGSSPADATSNQNKVEEEEEEVVVQDAYSAISSVDNQFKEPERITKWREEQRLRIETKDAEEEAKRQKWKEAAKKELDEWYKNRQEQLVIKLESNRIANKAMEAELQATGSSSASGSSEINWERVTKSCDFNPKANKNVKDVGRMRSILLQLKQQPLVR